MPRVSRDIAHRLASKKSSKKARRRPARQSAAPLAPPVVAATEARGQDERQPVTQVRRTGAEASRRATVMVADYAYVVSDLKRIALVAGGLLASLVVLSVIVR